jgi:hypothetical protein
MPPPTRWKAISGAVQSASRASSSGTHVRNASGSASTAHLAKLKIHATGKGNAKKPDMEAAAKARWGVDLGEDEADATWAGAFALDCGLFTN